MKQLVLTKKSFLLVFISLCGFWAAFGQAPSVLYIDNPLGSNEDAPLLYPANDGGFFIAHSLRKSTPDSIFASLTRLNASLAVQWARVYKVRANTVITAVTEESNGDLNFLLNAYNSASAYHVIIAKANSLGNIYESLELKDSASANVQASFFTKLKLQNGNQILLSSSYGTFVRVGPNGTDVVARQLIFKKNTNQVLYILGGKSMEGSNNWLCHGYITNTNLSFILKMADTTVVNFHVYDFKNISNLGGIQNIHIYPNEEMLTAHVDNALRLHICRWTPNGNAIWRKTFKIPSTNPGRLMVDNAGDIWLHGSITPGQAGGLLAHFSATGSYIGHKTQLAGGLSLGNISSFAQLPGNEYVTLQRGFYNASSALIVNRINGSMNFKCFQSNQLTFKDTSYAITDSLSTQVSYLKKRLGMATTLTFPIKTMTVSPATGIVACTTTSLVEQKEKGISFFPNPAHGSIQVKGAADLETVYLYAPDGKRWTGMLRQGNIAIDHVSPGLYVLELPGQKFRARLVIE